MQIAVYDSFPAAHRIRIDAAGTREPVHVHHWRVRVELDGPDDAMAAAARVRTWVRAWTARHRGRSLNDVPPFDVVNPTAEEVARQVAREFVAAFPDLRLHAVCIGEASGFSATYRPGVSAPR